MGNGTACEKCDAGTYSGAKAGYCEICVQGFYANDERTKCNECLAGFQCTAGIKTTCPDGKTSEAGSSYCDACDAGTFLEGDTCTPCTPGSISKGGASSCTVCETGTYQDGVDCKACEAGRWGATPGLSSFECSGLCAAGTYSFRYATTCIVCDAGKKSSVSGADDCEACDPSHPTYETSLPGSTECVCLPGKYNSTFGTCLPCSDGMDCSKAGSTVENMEVKSGNWRPNLMSTQVMACPIPKACLSTANTKQQVGIGMLASATTEELVAAAAAATTNASKAAAEGAMIKVELVSKAKGQLEVEVETEDAVLEASVS